MNTKLETLIADLDDFCVYLRCRETPTRFTDALINTVEYLRQADQQAQPVAWLYSEKGGKPLVSTIPPSCYEPNELSEHEVSVTPLFTSPPAQPQARELLPPEQLAAQAWCTPTTSSKVMDTDLCSAFADIIAADRAIRPAAGMVGDNELCIVKLIHHYGPYADFLMSDGTTRKLDSIDIGKYKWVYNESAAAQEPSNGQG